MRRTRLLAALVAAALAPGPLLAQAPMREPDATGALGPAMVW